jgi:pimeloyl-ACP methyl ester carboxylesterase
MKVQPALPPYLPRPLKATDIVAPGDIPVVVPANIFTEQPVPLAKTNAPLDIIRQGLRLSFIIYDPLDHLERELKEADFTNIEKLQVFYTGTQGICCVRGKTAFISFRGSASPLDWILDFLFVPFYWPLCHFGFGSAWRSVRQRTRTWLKTLPGDVKDIVICGHSLGGGVTHMAALDLAKDFPIKSVVTFGAPKACFLGTEKRYNASKINRPGEEKTLGDITYSVVNQRDMVSKVPFAFLGFRNVGNLVYIDLGGAVHYGTDAQAMRGKDSMTDMDFLINFMEEEKIGSLGPHSNSTEKFYYNMRRTVAWIGKNIPVLKSIILPSLMYILFSLYFMRSGLAHLGDKYMDVFMEPGSSPWKYTPYEKTGLKKYISLTVRFILGTALLGLFLWGLITIAIWSLSGLAQQ